MSNTIYIVDLAAAGIKQPARTLAGLWKQIEPLLHSGAPSPKYLELAAGLEEAIRSRAGKRMSLKKVQEGLENPRQQAKTLEVAAWAYGMPSDAGGPFDNGRVLHAIVLKAMELDLMVLADYLGVAFLPGEELIVESDLGVDWELLFEEPTEKEEPNTDPRMARAQMVKRVLTLLGDKLKPHGFLLTRTDKHHSGPSESSTHWFVREVGEGWQFVHAVDGSHSRDGLAFGFNAGGQNRFLNQILLNAFPERRKVEDYRLSLVDLDVYKKWCDSGRRSGVWQNASTESMVTSFRVQIEHGPFLEEAVDELLDVIVSAYVPILNAITDVRGILRLFLRGHGRLVEKKVAMAAENYRAAIVAGHLTRDAALAQFVEAVCDNFRADARLNEDDKNRFIARVQQLLNYLQENVPPWDGYQKVNDCVLA